MFRDRGHLNGVWVSWARSWWAGLRGSGWVLLGGYSALLAQEPAGLPKLSAVSMRYWCREWPDPAQWAILQRPAWARLRVNEDLQHPFFVEESAWSFVSPHFLREDGRIDGGDQADGLAFFRHTARLLTNHQALHTLRNCSARRLPNGSLVLYFQDSSPAGVACFVIEMEGNRFRAMAWDHPIFGDGPLPMKTLRQSLTLQRLEPGSGWEVQGLVDVLFELPGTRPPYRVRMKGPFRTKVFE